MPEPNSLLSLLEESRTILEIDFAKLEEFQDQIPFFKLIRQRMNTRINVSANSKCPCRIKCIAIVLLISLSFPSNTSELITVEGSDLNFFRQPHASRGEGLHFEELLYNLQ